MASDKTTIARAPFADAVNLIEVLTRDGCVIATGFTSPEDLTQVQRDVSPYMEGYTERRVCYSREPNRLQLQWYRSMYLQRCNI